MQQFADHRPLEEEFLLEVLDMPISFHRSFITLTGKVTAALLLSYLCWTGDEGHGGRNGWISKSLEAIRDETGLSKDELVTARRILRDLGIVEERRQGMPPILEFQVKYDEITRQLMNRIRMGQANAGLSGAPSSLHH